MRLTLIAPPSNPDNTAHSRQQAMGCTTWTRQSSCASSRRIPRWLSSSPTTWMCWSHCRRQVRLPTNQPRHNNNHTTQRMLTHPFVGVSSGTIARISDHSIAPSHRHPGYQVGPHPPCITAAEPHMQVPYPSCPCPLPLAPAPACQRRSHGQWPTKRRQAHRVGGIPGVPTIRWPHAV